MAAKKPKRPIRDIEPVSVPFPFDEAMRRVAQVKPPPEGFEQEKWRIKQKQVAKGLAKRRGGQ